MSSTGNNCVPRPDGMGGVARWHEYRAAVLTYMQYGTPRSRVVYYCVFCLQEEERQ